MEEKRETDEIVNGFHFHCLRALSLNLCEEGPARGRHGATRWAMLILYSQARIVGLQEIIDKTRNSDESFILLRHLIHELTNHDPHKNEWKIAFVQLDSQYSTCVLTSYSLTCEGEILLPNGRKLYALSVHLNDSPYQVCQLLEHCDYGDGAQSLKIEKEIISSAIAARGEQITSILDEIKNYSDTLLFGDLNEPSHLDWTHEAARNNVYPMSVSWPTTQIIESYGFHDTYRLFHKNKNVVVTPGTTYPSPFWKEYTGIPVRIDYIFTAESPRQIKNAGVFDISKVKQTEMKEKIWPSDHLGVWADISYAPPSLCFDDEKNVSSCTIL